MENEKPTRSRGRPRKPIAEGERPVVTIRFSPKQRAFLEKEADANGWSLAQEAAARIDRSMWFDTFLGGSHTAQLLQSLGSVIKAIEDRMGGTWRDDYLVSCAVDAGISRTARAHFPAPPSGQIAEYAFADLLDQQSMSALDEETAAKVREYEAAVQRAYDLGSVLAMGPDSAGRPPSKRS